MNSEIKEHEKATLCNEFQYKHKPRYESTLWRYKENGRYYSGPKDSDYGNKYYAMHHKDPVKCPLCGCMIVEIQMNRHQGKKRAYLFGMFQRNN